MSDSAAGRTGAGRLELLAGLTLAEKQNLWQRLCRQRNQDPERQARRQVLVAFVTSGSQAPGAPVARAGTVREQSGEPEYRDWLAQRLPGYAIPARIYPLESLPRLPSGKIDKAKLKELARASLAQEHESGRPGSAVPGSGRQLPEPLSPVEIGIYQALEKTWEKVLGCTVTDPGDHFFELGGDSILSIHVVSGMLKAGYKIGPNDLFNYPQIGHLARHLAVINAVEEPAELQSAVNDAALTPIQSWFFNTVTAHAGQWNLSRVFALPKAVDDGVVQQAIARLADKHDAFRITFRRKAGRYLQVLADAPSVSLQVVEIENKTLSDEVLRRMAGSYQTCFDLEQAPLIRFVFI